MTNTIKLEIIRVIYSLGHLVQPCEKKVVKLFKWHAKKL